MKTTKSDEEEHIPVKPLKSTKRDKAISKMKKSFKQSEEDSDATQTPK